MNFTQAKILIVGDVMLDQYWFGSTARISPEAPVPVVRVNRVDERPGGAANVALGVAALGAKPCLLGVTGYDDAAVRLEKLLEFNGVEHHLLRIEECATITKLRVLSRNQQMIRLDTEAPFILSQDSLLKEKYLELLPTVETVILSDYGKGTLMDTPWFIKEARNRNIPVVVDPKSNDFSVYHGASIVTPNLKEFEAVVGSCPTDEILTEKGKQLLNQHNIEALIITRSEHGLTVVTHEEINHIPAVAREVHDVTGAGDTVIAVIAAAVASMMPLISAATLGNIAAGIAVSKLGAAAVTLAELQAAVISNDSFPLGVMDEESLLKAIHLCKMKGEKIVFTNGCFDILHAGHVLYLEQAKRLGDRVIVAVNTDDSVKRLKGSARPINSLENRMNVLAGLKSVDWVVSFSEDTPERIIQAIAPDVLVKGGDYHDIEALPGARFVLSQNGQVKILGLKEGCSTTRMIDSILCKEDA